MPLMRRFRTGLTNQTLSGLKKNNKIWLWIRQRHKANLSVVLGDWVKRRHLWQQWLRFCAVEPVFCGYITMDIHHHKGFADEAGEHLRGKLAKTRVRRGNSRLPFLARLHRKTFA